MTTQRRNGRSLGLILAYLLPLLALAAAGGIFLIPKYRDMAFGSLLPMVFFWLAILTSVAGLATAAMLDYRTGKNISLNREIENGKFKESVLSEKTKQDGAMKESLAVMREIANKVNNDVDLDSTVSEVLIQIAGFIGRDNQELTLYLVEEISGQLEAKAHYADKMVFLNDELRRMSMDRAGVKDVFETCQPQYISGLGGEIGIVFPLSVAGKIQGVIKIKAQFDGTSDEKAEWMSFLEENLRSFMSIFSLAIRTPEFYRKAVVDGLTGLYTKRHFLSQLDYWISASMRASEPFSLMMLDIDHFKKVNDSYGHLSGDRVLKEVAVAVIKSIRSTSQAFRYGGEEMAVILPSATLKEAEIAAERLRKKVEKISVKAENGAMLSVTVSLGVAQWNGTSKDVNDLISHADKALYRAKETGRNKTCLAEA